MQKWCWALDVRTTNKKELELRTLYGILKRVEDTESVCGLTIGLRETAFCGHSYSKFCFGCWDGEEDVSVVMALQSSCRRVSVECR